MGQEILRPDDCSVGTSSLMILMRKDWIKIPPYASLMWYQLGIHAVKAGLGFRSQSCFFEGLQRALEHG